MKLQEKKHEFWGSSASSNGSTGSLAGKGGESQRRYTGLTSERLQEHDQRDETTEQLQHKAERLLQRCIPGLSWVSWDGEAVEWFLLPFM